MIFTFVKCCKKRGRGTCNKHCMWPIKPNILTQHTVEWKEYRFCYQTDVD